MSKVLYFGKRCESLYTPQLNGKSLEWVDSWCYLGVEVVAGKRYGCTANERIKKFYRCANAIFRVEGRSDEESMLRLLEAHCVPILTYGMEVAHFADHREKSKIRAAYNSLFRNLFEYRKFESVTDLQLSLGRPTWEMILYKAKCGFCNRLSTCNAESPVHVFSLI